MAELVGGSVNHAGDPPKTPQKLKAFKQVVVAAGDSITHGTFSSDYLSMLQQILGDQRYQFVNAGRNGDTSENLLKRIDQDVLAHQPDFITLLIGTNNARQDTELKQALETYRLTMEKIIFKIRAQTNVPIALISLAPLGENPHSEKNSEVAQYNAVLKDIAIQQNLGYLPLFEQLLPMLHDKVPADTSDFKLNLAVALIRAAFQKYILRKSWNAISAGNGLSILTDGIHLNDKSGAILADLIAGWLLSKD